MFSPDGGAVCTRERGVIVNNMFPCSDQSHKVGVSQDTYLLITVVVWLNIVN